MKLFLFFLFLIISCTPKKENSKKFNLVGNWVFLSKSMHDYSEMYVDSTHLKFLSEKDGYIGPFPYTIKNDTLFYANLFFCIKNGSSCDNYQFVNNDSSYFIYKLIMSKQQDDSLSLKNEINPFYFRRCFYLFSFGKINLLDAIKYLNESNNSDTKFEYDTILFSATKPKV